MGHCSLVVVGTRRVGTESSQHINSVLNENRNMIDSFAVINTELSSLAFNLKAAEEERLKHVQVQQRVVDYTLSMMLTKRQTSPCRPKHRFKNHSKLPEPKLLQPGLLLQQPKKPGVLLKPWLLPSRILHRWPHLVHRYRPVCWNRPGR